MFKKSSEHKGKVSDTPRAQVPRASERPPTDRVKEHKRSFLSPSISINGDLSGTEDLVVDGKVEGSITLPENEVVIGPKGQVKANVTALSVSVEGRVNGDIRGSERVVVKQSGRIEGNIAAPRVILEDGCQFNGSIEMTVDPESATPAGTSASPSASPSSSPTRTKSESESTAPAQKGSQQAPAAGSKPSSSS